jgi:hypothetical protein
MSSTLTGPFHQPPPRPSAAQTRRHQIPKPHGTDGQSTPSQAVAGASGGQEYDSGEIGTKDHSSSNLLAVDTSTAAGTHSRTTSKTNSSSASFLSPRLEADPNVPVQFPPRPTRDPTSRRNYAHSRSSGADRLPNASHNAQYMEPPIVARVYPQGGMYHSFRSCLKYTNVFSPCRLFTMERCTP